MVGEDGGAAGLDQRDGPLRLGLPLLLPHQHQAVPLQELAEAEVLHGGGTERVPLLVRRRLHLATVPALTAFPVLEEEKWRRLSRRK